MKLNCNYPIADAFVEKHNAFIERIQEPINRSKLPQLYCVLLQASFELSDNKSFFSQNDINKLTGELLSKYLNEGWAIIGCIECGAYLSNYHHTRASLELLACYHWVTYKSTKVDKRIKKYFEFKELNLYNYYQRFTNSQDKDGLSFFEDIDDSKLLEWNKKTSEWASLYNVEENKLADVINWHFDTRIDHMLQEFPNKRLKIFYDEICHATHFSPFSHSFGTDDSVLGLPVGLDGDLSKLDYPIKIYLESLESLFVLINRVIDYKFNVYFPSN